MNDTSNLSQSSAPATVLLTPDHPARSSPNGRDGSMKVTTISIVKPGICTLDFAWRVI